MSLYIQTQFWIHRICLVCFLTFSHTAVLWAPQKSQNSWMKWCWVASQMHSEGSKKIKREYGKLLSWSFQLLMIWQNNPERDYLPPTAMYSLINSGKLISECTQFKRLHQKNLHKNYFISRERTKKVEIHNTKSMWQISKQCSLNKILNLNIYTFQDEKWNIEVKTDALQKWGCIKQRNARWGKLETESIYKKKLLSYIWKQIKNYKEHK